jgi:hypothetical protein
MIYSKTEDLLWEPMAQEHLTLTGEALKAFGQDTFILLEKFYRATLYCENFGTNYAD